MGKKNDDVSKDDKEVDRIAGGGRGGDDVSEMLGQWRDDIDSTPDPNDK